MSKNLRGKITLLTQYIEDAGALQNMVRVSYFFLEMTSKMKSMTPVSLFYKERIHT